MHHEMNYLLYTWLILALTLLQSKTITKLGFRVDRGDTVINAGLIVSQFFQCRGNFERSLNE